MENHPITKSTYHVLRRVRGSKTVFQCADPTCNWRENKVYLSGKMATCFRCGADYILDTYALTLAKPHCENCTKGARGEEKRAMEKAEKSLLEKLGLAS